MCDPSSAGWVTADQSSAVLQTAIRPLRGASSLAATAVLRPQLGACAAASDYAVAAFRLSLLEPFSTTLPEGVLINALQVVDRLEAITRLKTFNLLGGLQIERDVRQLINAASEITQMPVRDRFAKLSQMSTMLAIENVAEMQDFWGANSDSISWRFNQLQVREVLRQRSDLDRSEISRLELTR